MTEVLNAVFYSFWTFIGTFMLIGVTGQAVARIVLAVRGVDKKGSDGSLFSVTTEQSRSARHDR